MQKARAVIWVFCRFHLSSLWNLVWSRLTAVGGNLLVSCDSDAHPVVH